MTNNERTGLLSLVITFPCLDAIAVTSNAVVKVVTRVAIKWVVNVPIMSMLFNII